MIGTGPLSFGFDTAAGLSFADLASKNSGDFAFGSKGKLQIYIWKHSYWTDFMVSSYHIFFHLTHAPRKDTLFGKA